MRNFGDTLRALLAGLLGVTASTLALYVLFWLSHDSPPDVHDLGTRAILLFASATSVAMVFAWIYAAWFDALFRGNALIRGTKFGIIAWFWLGAGAVLVYQVAGLPVPIHGIELWRTVALTAAPTLVHGAVVGIVFGSGRVYDEYRAGLGYGLPDRNSLA